MKDFLKFTLATITGIIVSSVILFFLSILVLFSMASTTESETIVKKNSIMMLDLQGTLYERNPEDPLSLLFSDDYIVYGLDDILSSIKKAKENENIKGIYIQANYLTCGYSSLEEIRDALQDFKESGKFIVAYADAYTQGLYYLSSVADKVLLNPKGMIEWKGLAASPIFYKDLLDKIGVEMQIFKVGTYKSAVEPFIATEMSPANREQITVYLNSIWEQITKDVAASRNISVDELNAAADRMMLFQPAEESVKCGLADTLIYKNDVRNYLKRMTGIDEDDDLPVLGAVEHVAPRGVGLAHAEADKGQGGLRQHTGTEVQNQVYQDHRHDIGQDMLEGNGVLLHTKGLGCSNILAFPGNQHLAPNQPGQTGPGQHTEYTHDNENTHILT